MTSRPLANAGAWPLLVVLCFGGVSLGAFADDNTQQNAGTAPASSDDGSAAGNEFRLGVGGLETPAYLGSEARRKLLVPIFSATFDDRFYIGGSGNAGGGGAAAGSIGGGVGMFLFKDREYTWTLGLGGDFPRKEDYAPELAGMGDRPVGAYIDTGLVWHPGIFHVAGDVGVGLRSGEGSRAGFDVGLGGAIAERWIANFGINALVVNAQQNFFDYGISDSQAAARATLIAAGDPRLQPGEAGPYTPAGGLQHTGFGGSLTYLIDRNWAFSLFASEAQLRGSALDSPLVRTNHGTSFGLFLSYHFRTQPSP